MTLNKDSCSGDAGGPVICSRNSSHPYYGHELELKGLVSWGIGCGAPGYPGVYTKVFPFIDWIRTQTEQFDVINDIEHMPFSIQGPFEFDLIKSEVLHRVQPVLTTKFDPGVEYWKRIGLKKSLKSFGAFVSSEFCGHGHKRYPCPRHRHGQKFCSFNTLKRRLSLDRDQAWAKLPIVDNFRKRELKYGISYGINYSYYHKDLVNRNYTSGNSRSKIQNFFLKLQFYRHCFYKS